MKKWKCPIDGCDKVIKAEALFRVRQSIANHLVKHGLYNRLTDHFSEIESYIEKGLKK